MSELRGDEHLAPAQPGLGDGRADLSLVSVHLGSVDVPVARRQGVRHGCLGLRGGHQEDAESELRNGLAVVQHDLGDSSHDISPPEPVDSVGDRGRFQPARKAAGYACRASSCQVRPERTLRG